MTVQRILNSKGPAVPTILPDSTIVDVIARLDAEDSGALVISSDGKAIEGIISERDIVRGLRQFGTDALAKKVTELMTEKGLYLHCQRSGCRGNGDDGREENPARTGRTSRKSCRDGQHARHH